MEHSLSPATVRALLVGLVLGTLVWAMSQSRSSDGFGLAMALLLLSSGTASFLCHALCVEPHGRVRRWLLALAAGVLASLAALNQF